MILKAQLLVWHSYSLMMTLLEHCTTLEKTLLIVYLDLRFEKLKSILYKIIFTNQYNTVFKITNWSLLQALFPLDQSTYQ